MTGRDAKTVARAVKYWPNRWRGQTAAVKERMVGLLDQAAKTTAQVLKSPEDNAQALAAAGVAANIVRASAAIEDQVQKDEHLTDKNTRMDAGKPTELLAGVMILPPEMPPEPHG